MSIVHRIIPPAQAYATLTINEVNIRELQVRRGKMTKEREMNRLRQHKRVKLIPLSIKFF